MGFVFISPNKKPKKKTPKPGVYFSTFPVSEFSRTGCDAPKTQGIFFSRTGIWWGLKPSIETYWNLGPTWPGTPRARWSLWRHRVVLGPCGPRPPTALDLTGAGPKMLGFSPWLNWDLTWFNHQTWRFYHPKLQKIWRVDLPKTGISPAKLAV